jgi:hypothetical protein
MLNSLERFRIFLMALVAFFYGPYFLLHIEFMKNEPTKCARRPCVGGDGQKLRIGSAQKYCN